MRYAHIVPTKYLGLIARFFAAGLQYADRLSRHHSPEPRNLLGRSPQLRAGSRRS